MPTHSLSPEEQARLAREVRRIEKRERREEHFHRHGYYPTALGYLSRLGAIFTGGFAAGVARSRAERAVRAVRPSRWPDLRSLAIMLYLGAALGAYTALTESVPPRDDTERTVTIAMALFWPATLAAMQGYEWFHRPARTEAAPIADGSAHEL